MESRGSETARRARPETATKIAPTDGGNDHREPEHFPSVHGRQWVGNPNRPPSIPPNSILVRNVTLVSAV
jgi:hypothetical protein